VDQKKQKYIKLFDQLQTPEVKKNLDKQDDILDRMNKIWYSLSYLEKEELLTALDDSQPE
jgi:hypothetical protein